MVDTPKLPAEFPAASDATRQGGAEKPQTVFSLSEDETADLGRTLARNLKGGELILLEGDLGLGKTVFARGIATGLGIAPEDVNSPSFTLVQEYTGGRLPMFHVDLYRLTSGEEIETLGVDDLLASDAIVVIEWGDKLPPHHKRGAITVRFHDVGEGSRRIEVLGAAGEKRRRVGDA
jgi:tRNA threonylcarbamoyladenosine biosynthesis protein TsaE